MASQGLHIDLPPPAAAGPTSKIKPKTVRQKEVVESWEDDDADGDVESETPTQSERGPIKSPDPALHPPPPTPISPGNSGQYIDWSPAQVLGGGRPNTTATDAYQDGDRDAERERKRPEKTTATASRMIAAGLGIKPARKTEDQRQYDRAVREQEMRKRIKEKEEQERTREADERLKAAVWDA